MDLLVEHPSPAQASSQSETHEVSELTSYFGALKASPKLTRLLFLVVDVFGALCAGSVGVLIARILGADVHIDHAIKVLPYFGVFIPIFLLSGLYRVAPAHPAEELRRGTIATTMVALSLVTFWWLTGAVTHDTVVVALGAFLTLPLILPAFRLVARLTFSRADWWGAPVVILSSGSGGDETLDAIQRWPEMGLRPVTVLQVRTEFSGDGVGNLDDEAWMATVLAEDYGIPYAVVDTGPGLDHQALARQVQRYSRRFKRVFVVRHFAGAPVIWSSQESVGGLLGFGIQHAAWRRGTRFAKKIFDLVGASFALLITSPVIAITVLLIRLDSKGGAFFRQSRLGENGRIFDVIKFRTMHVDADRRLAEILDNSPEAKEEYSVYHKLRNDPRVTRVGRFLRRLSLDELPQLWNVLRGEMTLVGPRAYLPRELPSMEGVERVILQHRPGLTGLWQVSGRNQLCFGSRINIDVHYIHNWSPWLDLYILAKTFPVVVRGEGAC